MKACIFVQLSTAAALTTVLPVQAQTTIDVSKITCAQWLTFEVADPNFIALWLSGYYNGKRDNTVVEVQAFKDDIEKLRKFCIGNPKAFIMKAVETMIIQSKK